MVLMILIVIILEHNIIKYNRKKILITENIKKILYNLNED